MSVMQKNNFSVKEWLCQHKFVAGTAIAARCSAVDLPLRLGEEKVSLRARAQSNSLGAFV